VLTDHPEEHAVLDPEVEVLPCDVRDFHAVITRISTHHRPDAVVSNSDHLQTQTALAAAAPRGRVRRERARPSAWR